MGVRRWYLGPIRRGPEHQSRGGDHAVSLITKITDKDGKIRDGDGGVVRGPPEVTSSVIQANTESRENARLSPAPPV